MTPGELLREANELEQMADGMTASFDTFLAELNGPLNVLRQIAGKQPRDLRRLIDP